MTAEVLWYLNRATGVVLLVLSTLAVVLGVVVARRGRLPGAQVWGRGGRIPPGAGGGSPRIALAAARDGVSPRGHRALVLYRGRRAVYRLTGIDALFAGRA